jgi:acid stress-induced BolA-like protein IbaG/YrbA
MLPMMLTEERLREVLGKTEGVTDIFIGREGYKFVAIVVSPWYESMESWQRQEHAWGLLLKNLTDDEHARVSFVYTNTPEEQAQADRDAAAEGR